MQATFSITVIGGQSIQISPAQLSISNGQTSQLSATVTYSDNTTKDVTSSATWTSSSSSIATVSSQGLFTAVSSGNVSISAAYAGATATANYSVVNLQTISISPVGYILLPGASVQLAATGNYSDGSTSDLTGKVNWSSSETSVATISSTGDVTASMPGSYSITASYDGVQGNQAFTVAGATAFQISAANAVLFPGAQQQLQAIVTYPDGSMIDITSQATWSSSATDVATVTASGLLSINKAGTVTITATAPQAISGQSPLTATLAPTINATAWASKALFAYLPGQDGIHVYQIDSTSGQPSPVGVILNPGGEGLAIDPSGQFAYQRFFSEFLYVEDTATLVAAEHAVYAYQINQQTGLLSPLSSNSMYLAKNTTGDVSKALRIDADEPIIATDKFVFVGNPCRFNPDFGGPCPFDPHTPEGVDGSISVLARDAVSGATSPTSSSPVYFNVGSFQVDPKDRFVLAKDANPFEFIQPMYYYTLDSSTGNLTQLQNGSYPTNSFGTSLPVAVDSQGRYFEALSNNGPVGVYTQPNGQAPNILGSQGAALALDQQGAYDYLSGVLAASGTIETRSIDPTAGPTVVSTVPSQVNSITSMAVDPADKFVFAAGVPSTQSGPNLDVYSVDPTSHSLQPVTGEPFTIQTGWGYDSHGDSLGNPQIYLVRLAN